MGLTEKQKWLIFFMIGILMGGISFYSHHREKMMIYEVSGKGEENQVKLNIDPSFIMVHLEGAVAKPALYKMKEGGRLADAIEAAGGLTEKADRKKVNLAMKLEDGTQVYIPAKGEEKSNSPTGQVSGENSNQTNNNINNGQVNSLGKININHASAEELTKLKGIGEALAARIIEYRQQQGPFNSIEEIKNVKGIGEKKYLQIKDHITP
ncbi:helix-hairpin-helix domain-containing protein [Alkaliphilus hydrothermalis]|uniref:Competence protein ComEA n=1 Tax=Alkaliphilus hydrothermalis TaxID=1482730 RepID=A0ABS2NLP0_9FIRM|nr:helix-hairpin-helix domain-containing protein [Alkaliphilus hydrothermalis]MBM7613852.1 competence protein ComEA [Alkaliphilus hydrothermalis]